MSIIFVLIVFDTTYNQTKPSVNTARRRFLNASNNNNKVKSMILVDNKDHQHLCYD